MVENEKQGTDYKHIVRIANVDIPGNKPIKVALTKIKGIGKNLADMICKMAKVKRDAKTGNLKSDELERLNKVANNPLGNNIPSWAVNRKKDYETGEDKHLLTGTLNFVQDNDLKRLKKLKTYRGVRHIKRLPVRGQRTKSNFRRSKGKVVGVARKKGKSGK